VTLLKIINSGKTTKNWKLFKQRTDWVSYSSKFTTFHSLSTNNFYSFIL